MSKNIFFLSQLSLIESSGRMFRSWISFEKILDKESILGTLSKEHAKDKIPIKNNNKKLSFISLID